MENNNQPTSNSIVNMNPNMNPSYVPPPYPIIPQAGGNNYPLSYPVDNSVPQPPVNPENYPPIYNYSVSGYPAYAQQPQEQPQYPQNQYPPQQYPQQPQYQQQYPEQQP